MRTRGKLARMVRVVLPCLLLLGSLATAAQARSSPAAARASTGSCQPDAQQASGALYRICMPAEGAWNSDLVVYAHGYVHPGLPLAIPEDQLGMPGGPSIPEAANTLGFAFAATSYSTNGLAVEQGIGDLIDLVDIFSRTHGRPGHVYLVGVSEGGLITALAVEQHPEVFSGGLAACGPIGSFFRQTDYLGDVRVMLDYFFPGLVPGSPVQIPQQVIDGWRDLYAPQAMAALRNNLVATAQLLVASGVPLDLRGADPTLSGVLEALGYNIYATNDAVAKLGGQPYGNGERQYRGSADDAALNLQVQRFVADAGAVAEVEAHLETSGRLSVPLVTLHTLSDPVVPYWHEELYRAKAEAAGSGAWFTSIPVARCGHCSFSAAEALWGFGLLVAKVRCSELVGAERVLPDEQARAEYAGLAAGSR